MFEDIRREISHFRRSREDKALKDAEKKRRLSYIRMRRMQEREAQEKELRQQTHAEIGAIELAHKAKQERELAERELKATRPSAAKSISEGARRLIRGTGKVAKGVSRIASVGVSPKTTKRLHNLVFAPPGLWGPEGGPKPTVRGHPTPRMSDEEFVFGAGSAKSPITRPNRKSTRDLVFGKPGDLLK